MGSRDFTYNLILKQDKESWAGGARSVDKLANNVSRLIGTAQAAAAAYAALKGVVEGSKLASESAILSDSLGASVKRLEDWKVAAKIAGVSSSELTKSMGALDRKFTEWKNRGKADTGMAVALGQLGLNASDMFDMSADERARVILQAASTMKDTKNAAALVSQLLGGAGEQMYHFMRLSNTSVDRLLERSRRFSLVDDGVAKKGFAFTTELNTTMAALQQLGTFAGATFGANFTDFLKNVNKFFSDNGTSIAKKITGFSNSLKTIGDALKPFADGALKIAASALFDLTDALARLLEGDYDQAYDKLVNFLKNSAQALKDVLLGKNIGEKIKDAVQDAKDQGKGVLGQAAAAGEVIMDSPMGKLATMGGLPAKAVQAGGAQVDKGINYLKEKRGQVNCGRAKKRSEQIFGATHIARRHYAAGRTGHASGPRRLGVRGPQHRRLGEDVRSAVGLDNDLRRLVLHDKPNAQHTGSAVRAGGQAGGLRGNVAGSPRSFGQLEKAPAHAGAKVGQNELFNKTGNARRARRAQHGQDASRDAAFDKPWHYRGKRPRNAFRDSS